MLTGQLAAVKESVTRSDEQFPEMLIGEQQ